MALRRLPFYPGLLMFGIEECQLPIYKPDPDSEVVQDMSAEFAAFLHFYGRCCACGARVATDLAKCGCGKPSDDDLQIVVAFPTSIFREKYLPIERRENGRKVQLRRIQAIQENGGSYSREEVAALYTIQLGLCYYCGYSLGQAFDSAVFDEDHYDPVCEGGRNDIFNIVLACPTCNRTKGSQSGLSFERKMQHRRSPEIASILREVRKARKAFLASIAKSKT